MPVSAGFPLVPTTRPVPPAGGIAAGRDELARAERLAGQARRDALQQLAARLAAEAPGAADSAKVRLLASAVRDLASAGG